MKYNKQILDDISVIIQGKVFGKPGELQEEQLTSHCIESVRRVLPNAEIILSTWEGTDVSHLSFDKVIFNKDPGAVLFNEQIPGFYNNNNRQIVSTYNGLKAATKMFAIKLRGDCQLLNSGFIDFLGDYQKAPKYSFLAKRIIVPTKYSRNPRRIALLFHPSDIFQVGLISDMLDLWNIPLQPEPETTRGIPANKRIINDALPGPGFKMKHCSEQYLWYAFAKKKGLDLELKHFSNLPISKIFKSELSIINNYVIADAERIGLRYPPRFEEHNFKDLYTHSEWEVLYKKYCLTGATIFDKISLISQVYYSNYKTILKRILSKVLRVIKLKKS